MNKSVVLLVCLAVGCSFGGLPSVSAHEQTEDRARTKPGPDQGMSLESYKLLMPLIKEKNDQYMDEAFAAMTAGEMQKAMEIFYKASRNAPYDPRPYMHLANIYFEYGMDDMAYKVLERSGRFKTSHDAIFRHLRYRDLKDDPTPGSEQPRVSIANFKGNKDAAVTFMFDDGPKSVYTTALPILDAYGYKGTVAVNPGVIGDGTGTHPAWGVWSDWKDASSRGHEIANHGYDHIGLTDQDAESLEHQVNDSHEQITRKVGKAPLTFVFPSDLVNERSMRKALERHIALRSHEYLTRVYDHVFIPIYGGEFFSNETGERVIDLAIYKKLWLIAQCHAVKTEEIRTYKPVTEDFLKEHLSYIKAHEDRIWVDTFINVFRYLYSRKNANLEILKDAKRKVVFRLTSSLKNDFAHNPLTVVIDTGSGSPRKVSARQEGRDDPVEVVTEGSQIYLTAFPSNRQITVSWR